MISKTERQAIGATKWANAGGIGTLLYYMRFGKTFAGIQIAQKVLVKDDTRTTIIAVPSEIVNYTWETALKVYAQSNTIDLSRIRILTIHQFEQYDSLRTANCTLLIIDEIHLFCSPKGRMIVDKTLCNYKFILGLTGTFPSGEAGEFLTKHCPIVDSIPKNTAVANGWIATTMEYNISLQLDKEDTIRYIRHSEPISEILDLFKGKSDRLVLRGRKMFDNDYALITGCHAGITIKAIDGVKQYVHASKVRELLAMAVGWTATLDLNLPDNQNINVNWHPECIKENSAQFNEHVRLRTEILNNNEVKLNATVAIFEANPVTTICFSESTEFADRLADRINDLFPGKAICYHSNIESTPLVDPITGLFITQKNGKIKKFGKDKIKQRAIEGLRSGEFKFLSTVRAVDQGLDVPEIEQVIITAGTLNPLQHAQRSARASTIDVKNINKVALIVNLYFNDMIDDNNKVYSCRDKVKLRARQVNCRSEVHWISNVENFIHEFI